MSADPTKLLQAAQIATAAANVLAAKPGQPMTAGSAAELISALVPTIGLMNPNAGVVLALASIAMNAVHVATTGEAGFTPEQIKALVAADDAAIAADQAAHPAAAA